MTFKNDHLSVSRLKNFEQCQKAFYFQYIAKGPKDPRGEEDPALFGNILHIALERFYQWVMDTEFSGAFPVDQLLGFYREAFQESTMAGVVIFQEGLQILRDYAKSHSPVDHWKIVAVEQEFNLQVEEFVVNGYIDRVDHLSPDTIAIIDYKSQRKLFTKHELANDLQMAIYGLAARTLWPWAKNVVFVFHLLRHDTHQGTTRTPQQIDEARDYVVALGRRTEDPNATFPAVLNGNCSYCDHRSRCDVYQNAVLGKHPYVVADKKDLEAVAVEREIVYKVGKAAYARRDALDKVLKKRLEEVGEFTAGGMTYAFQTYGTTEHDAEHAVKVLAKFGVGTEEAMREKLVTSSIKNADLNAVLKEAEEKVGRGQVMILKAHLDAHAERTNHSRIDARKA